MMLRLLGLRANQKTAGGRFPAGLVGVNLGKNKTSEDAAAGGSAAVGVGVQWWRWWCERGLARAGGMG